MRKQHNEESAPGTLRMWTYAEAVNALPYLDAVVRSLREHWLEWQRARLHVGRLDAQPGRPDRGALILRAEAARAVEQAEDELEVTLHELNALDVYSLDPGQGLALIPFRQGDDLAWFVFDLFAPRRLETWQFDADPPQTRRPMVEQSAPGLAPTRPTAALDLLMSRGGLAADDWPADLGGTRA
jgi:hypothetical protein